MKRIIDSLLRRCFFKSSLVDNEGSPESIHRAKLIKNTMNFIQEKFFQQGLADRCIIERKHHDNRFITDLELYIFVFSPLDMFELMLHFKAVTEPEQNDLIEWLRRISAVHVNRHPDGYPDDKLPLFRTYEMEAIKQYIEWQRSGRTLGYTEPSKEETKTGNDFGSAQ